MFGQLVLLFFVLLWLIAWAIEKAFFPKPTRWWRSGLISLGLLVLLHADAVIGYFVEYRPAVKEAGNGQVFKHVVADGFLDRYGSYVPTELQHIEPGLVLFTKDYPFRYVEMWSAFASKSRLLAPLGSFKRRADATYVHFYKGFAGGPDCAAFEALPDVSILREKYAIPVTECVAAKQTPEPISRYEVTESPSRKLNPKSPFLVTGHERLVMDLQSGEVIAQCRALSFRPQISRLIFVQLMHGSYNPSCNRHDEFWRMVISAIGSPTKTRLQEH